MHNIVTVHEVARFQHLPYYFLRFQGLNARIVISSLQLVEDGPIELLEDEEDAIVLPEHLQQVHDMVVLQLLQNTDLSQGRLSHLHKHTSKKEKGGD